MKTLVVFRVDRAGEVFALFPETAADSAGRCNSYQHIGQHGAADYDGCIRASRPAYPWEYSDLASELRSIGYVLDIRLRANSKSQARRMGVARRRA